MLNPFSIKKKEIHIVEDNTRKIRWDEWDPSERPFIENLKEQAHNRPF